MDECDFDGTMVLQRMAEIEKIDDFLEAVDSDDFAKAKSLMRLAQIDSATIAIVLRKMASSDGDHSRKPSTPPW